MQHDKFSVTNPSQEELEAMLAEAPWRVEDFIGFCTPEAVDERFLARLEHEMELRGELPSDLEFEPFDQNDRTGFPGLLFGDGPDVGDLVE